MNRSEATRDGRRTGFSLSQETVTVLTVGVALAGLILVSVGDLRSEARADRAEARADRAEARADREAIRAEGQADREALRAEGRADREAIRAEGRADRAEGRADREALRAEARADREAFAKQITRLVERQGTLSGLVDGLRQATASPEG